MAITLTDGEKLVYAAAFAKYLAEYKAAWWQLNTAARVAMKATLFPGQPEPPWGIGGYAAKAQDVRQALLTHYASQVGVDLPELSASGLDGEDVWASAMATAKALEGVQSARFAAVQIAAHSDTDPEAEAPNTRDMLAQVFDVSAEPPEPEEP